MDEMLCRDAWSLPRSRLEKALLASRPSRRGPSPKTTLRERREGTLGLALLRRLSIHETQASDRRCTQPLR